MRQSIASSLTIDVPLIELPDERTALQKFAHDAAIPFDLQTGPLIRASLVRIAAAPGASAHRRIRRQRPARVRRPRHPFIFCS